MECPFQVGDQVVCIFVGYKQDLHAVGYYGPSPELNERYTVRSLMTCDCGCNQIGVQLKEIECQLNSLTGEEFAWHHSIFRKLLTIEDFMSKDVDVPVDSVDKVEKVPEHV